jgi:hypothetical protein
MSKCKICGRDLKDAKSIELGIGPVCAEKVKLSKAPDKVKLSQASDNDPVCEYPDILNCTACPIVEKCSSSAKVVF